MVAIDYNKIQIGDRLVRTKGGILSKHHAIYIGKWQDENCIINHYIAENQNGYGVRIIKMNEFLNTGKLVRIDSYSFPTDKQNFIIDRVNKRIGLRYKWFSYNCEHFVNEVLFGVTKSIQIENLVMTGMAVPFGLVAISAIASK